MISNCSILFRCKASDNILNQEKCEFFKSINYKECIYQGIYNPRMSTSRYMCTSHEAHIFSMIKKIKEMKNET